MMALCLLLDLPVLLADRLHPAAADGTDAHDTGQHRNQSPRVPGGRAFAFQNGHQHRRFGFQPPGQLLHALIHRFSPSVRRAYRTGPVSYYC